jgi:uncharacterized protein with gpF-like domain
LLATDVEVNDFVDNLYPVYAAEYRRAGRKETKSLAALSDTELLDFEEIENYRAHVLPVAKEIVATSEKKIRRQIYMAQEMGLSQSQLLEMVKTSTAFSGNRAEAIARTETTKTISEAKSAAIRQAGAQGVRATKTWITEDDEQVRDTHLELDGVTVSASADFVSSGGSAAGPGQFGIASEDINCRCIIIAQIAD